ncbi:LIMD2 protein [Capsaspora owczarzaki ATCC 30864]|uniref:LIMD2 protein n=1 Tax=Capsaspora owczarzaki (strain ATCC 30864) TaxID=595528 RepID=A0A0D2WXB8_CAPO3|nr:LIMD2 protein [Capsaspora owczarzaki ATCC 30864]KJE97398.1 LIMD2 protein [Capsaspora owczarzaki ATCC 30864]|eukprot:XP_004343126.1 LIMD2 protein [Capsaspora owczarzaki ATCC 30864]
MSTDSEPKKIGGFKPQPRVACEICDKTVYPMEQISADGHIYHKTCFRCQECKKILSLGAYSAVAGQVFCKPHFTQIFKTKGNYDTAFGKESLKAKWAPAPAAEPVRSSRYSEPKEEPRRQAPASAAAAEEDEPQQQEEEEEAPRHRHRDEEEEEEDN